MPHKLARDVRPPPEEYTVKAGSCAISYYPETMQVEVVNTETDRRAIVDVMDFWTCAQEMDKLLSRLRAEYAVVSMDLVRDKRAVGE